MHRQKKRSGKNQNQSESGRLYKSSFLSHSKFPLSSSWISWITICYTTRSSSYSPRACPALRPPSAAAEDAAGHIGHEVDFKDYI
jgi:hypothetical protein